MRTVINEFARGLFALLIAASCSFAQQPTEKTSQADSGYVLGPDDQIVIHAIEAPEITEKPILIGSNGNITLPLIGRVKAGGLTVEQFETELNSRMIKYVKDPQLSVMVVESRSHPVSVFGAVTKPGVVQLPGRKTLYEVLSMAGGPRETAGPNLTVTRRRRENGDIPLASAKSDPTGEFSVADLNLHDILDGNQPGTNIEIKPHDVISVSEGSSSMIYVVGDVQHAGAFSVGGRQTMSVLSALALAGGLGRTAKPEKARIVRSVAEGLTRRQVTVGINVKQVLSGKAEDIGLHPQDVLVVPSSSRKSFVTSFIPATVSSAVGAAIYHY